METVYLKMYAANTKGDANFNVIGEERYKGKPIFDYACDCANRCSGFKRNNRRMQILGITDKYIVVKLISEGPLSMPAKVMAAFTRELLEIEKELYPDEKNHIFGSGMYHDTVFSYQEVSKRLLVAEAEISCDDLAKGVVEQQDISDTDALKMCVDLFCNNACGRKIDRETLLDKKGQIKNLLIQLQEML